MPPAALADFTEWAQPQAAGPTAEAYLQFSYLLQHEVPMEKLSKIDADAPPLTDDRPINEYYLYRRWTSTQTEPAGQGAE